MRNTRLASAAGVPAGLAVTVNVGETINDQETSWPVRPVVSSVTMSFQVPLMLLPSNTFNGCAGRNDWAKGALPELIGLAPASSNTVLLKFWPVPPTLEK